jgi:hypothetical protein
MENLTFGMLQYFQPTHFGNFPLEQRLVGCDYDVFVIVKKSTLFVGQSTFFNLPLVR